MKFLSPLCGAILLTSLLSPAFAENNFDPSRLKGPRSGPKNQILVLGTVHLSGLPSSFQPDKLGLLLERLAAWQAQTIVVESLSGLQCEAMRHYPQRYLESVKDYCWDTRIAQKETGKDVISANVAVETQLANWPAQADAAHRRQLAANFLAAGEPVSAVLQWRKLSADEQHAGDGLSEALVALLQKLEKKRDESYQIAVPLALRAGLERIYGVDDHTADSPDASAEEAQESAAALQSDWNNPATHKRQALDKSLAEHWSNPAGVLKIYRTLNQAEQGQLIFASDFGAAMNEPSAKNYGRKYLGYWETRNLRMVANIRDIMGQSPGKRTLAIVGASHKPYYEAYLRMMHDVQVVSTDAVLKARP